MSTARHSGADQIAQLGKLRDMSQAKSEAELAKLARVGQSLNRLRNSLEALRKTEEPLAPSGSFTGSPADDPVPIDPALVRARLAHRRWSDAQRSRLNQQLALVRADYERLRPAATQAFGRAQVLGALTDQAKRARKQKLIK